MADRLVWSPEAIEDIEAIAAYIERDSPHYARVVASRLVETAESIPDFPKIGRIVPEAGGRRPVVSYPFMESGAGRERVRLVSAREPTRNERRFYEDKS